MWLLTDFPFRIFQRTSFSKSFINCQISNDRSSKYLESIYVPRGEVIGLKMHFGVHFTLTSSQRTYFGLFQWFLLYSRATTNFHIPKKHLILSLAQFSSNLANFAQFFSFSPGKIRFFSSYFDQFIDFQKSFLLFESPPFTFCKLFCI